MVSTPLSAPVVAATRLRGGNAASARGAASLAVQAIGTARACGCTGLLIVRLDSAYYNAAVIGAVFAGRFIRYHEQALEEEAEKAFPGPLVKPKTRATS